MAIGPKCPHCGIHVREQFYSDVARAFEVQAGVYHSFERCRSYIIAELFAARLVVSACRTMVDVPKSVADAVRLYDAVLNEPERVPHSAPRQRRSGES
jgi:hypothetical protein